MIITQNMLAVLIASLLGFVIGMYYQSEVDIKHIKEIRAKINELTKEFKK